MTCCRDSADRTQSRATHAHRHTDTALVQRRRALQGRDVGGGVVSRVKVTSTTCSGSTEDAERTATMGRFSMPSITYERCLSCQIGDTDTKPGFQDTLSQ